MDHLNAKGAMSSEYLVHLDPEVKGRLFSLLKSCAKCKIIVTPDSGLVSVFLFLYRIRFYRNVVLISDAKIITNAIYRLDVDMYVNEHINICLLKQT